MSFNWKNVERIAKAHIQIDPTVSIESLKRFLEMWWCFKYDRPFKDPLLQKYTLDELIYEYLIHHYMEPDNNPKNQKDKDTAEKSEEEWIKKMLSKHKKGIKTKEKKKEPEPKTDPNTSIPIMKDISTKFTGFDE